MKRRKEMKGGGLLMIFRLDRRKLVGVSLLFIPVILLGLVVGFTAQGFEVEFALVLLAIGMYASLVWQYVSYSLQLSEKGIISGRQRKKSLAWHEISSIHRTGTGAGPVVVWKGGYEIRGKTSNGKRVRIGIPPAFRPRDLEEISKWLRKYGPHS